jgi:hypothetical protein
MPWMDLPASQVDVFAFLMGMNYLEELEATDFGFYYAMIRDDPADGPPIYTLVVPFILPTTVMPVSNDAGSIYVIDVPVDDVTTLNFWVQTNTAGAFPPMPAIWQRLPYLYEQAPGRLIPTLKMNQENRYLQDRASLRNGTYAGFLGRPSLEDPSAGTVMGMPGSLYHQDCAIMLAQGPYPTRSMEHRVPCDIGVLRLRQQLADLARQVAAGATPPSVTADLTDVRGCDGHHVDDWRQLIPGTGLVDVTG